MTRRPARYAVIAALAAGCLAHSGHSRLQTDSAELASRAPDVCHVRLDTSKGTIVLEMRHAWAPYGVDRFYDLVRTGYYDDVAIFRVRAGVFSECRPGMDQDLVCEANANIAMLVVTGHRHQAVLRRC
jgi:peptidyl-prolyl cis-trans isomerase A (cyclophilin A)